MFEIIEGNRSAPTAGRWFVRCHDCLTVAALDGRPPEGARCGCGGRIETMGQVTRGGRLGWTATVSACDYRCTNAKGPSCDCPCGGENHGSKRVVTVTVDAGGIPKVSTMPPTLARKAGEVYRDLRSAAWAAHRARYGDVMERKAEGQWIPNWTAYLDARSWAQSITRATEAKSHTARNNKLVAIIHELRRGP